MLLLVNIDRSVASPLQDQIYGQTRDLISTGRLKSGARMPATRLLAEQLQVSRNTVVLAYERLIAEGYLETSPAFGTFVSNNPPRHGFGPPTKNNSIGPLPLAAPERAAESRPAANGDEVRGPLSGSPDPELFPIAAWRRLLLPILERHGARATGLPVGATKSLQHSLAVWLGYSRGITVAPEELIVVAGRHQAYDIAAHLLLRQGSRAVVETPGFPGAAGLFQGIGADVVPVAVDEHGIDVDALPSGRAALVHVTPDRQYPIGGTLPQVRRERLLAWAHGAGARIIEDDCDGSFHYNGAHPPPLKCQDTHGLVFHVGSVANALGPLINIGYVVPPRDLLDAARRTATLVDNDGAWLEHMALAHFIDSGSYGRHLLRLRKIYLTRRNELVDALRKSFGEVRLIGTDSGTYFTWLLPQGFVDATTVERLARGLGITVRALRDTPSWGGAPLRFANRTLFIGYATATQQQIRRNVAALATAIANSAK